MDDWHHPSTADGCPGCNCCELPDCTREHRACPGQIEIRSDVGEPAATLTIREVPACTACGRIGHLAENCTKV